MIPGTTRSRRPIACPAPGLAAAAVVAIYLLLASFPSPAPAALAASAPPAGHQAAPPAAPGAGTGSAPSLTVPVLTDLVERAAALDGTRVTIRGEVIGDVLRRKGYAWINVSDGTTAIGVRVPLEILAPIQHVGRWGMKGDTVTVVGTFHRMDPASGGDLDIVADRLEVSELGGPLSHPVARARLVAAAAGALGVALTGGLWWRRRVRGLA